MRAVVLASAAMLSACASQAPAPPPAISPSEVASSTSIPTRDYFEAVTSLHLYVIRSGELALQRSANPFHREFAARMIAEHRAMLKRLAAAGRRARLKPAAALHPSHQAWLDQLLAARDPILFDATYPRNQMLAHGVAARLHGAYALYGDVGALRGIAAELMRVAEEHERIMRMRPISAMSR